MHLLKTKSLAVFVRKNTRLSPVFARCCWMVFALVLLCKTQAGDHTSFPQFRVETARDYWRELSELIPLQIGTNAEGLFLQARLQRRLGEVAQAEGLSRKAFQSDTNRAEIAVFLANMLIRDDKLDEAVVLLRKGVAAQPQVEGGYRLLGMALDRLGDPKAAREAFDAAVQYCPKDPTSWLLRGKLLLDQGLLQEAVSDLKESSRLDPESANPFYPLFQAQTKLGNTEAASAALSNFQKLKKVEKAGMGTFAEDGSYDNEADMRKSTAGFHVEVAKALMRENREELAEKHLRQAIDIAPLDPQAYEVLGRYYVIKRRLAEARLLIEEVVKLKPNDVSSHINLGTMLLESKDYGPAVAELRRALELDPKQQQALHNLARHFLSTRTNLAEALILCQRLVACKPEAANYDLLAWACYANGNTNEALKAAGQAIENEPTNPVYRDRLKRLQGIAGTAH
jgi:tetratricopeptide (TPR) repeat protein